MDCVTEGINGRNFSGKGGCCSRVFQTPCPAICNGSAELCKIKYGILIWIYVTTDKYFERLEDEERNNCCNGFWRAV